MPKHNIDRLEKQVRELNKTLSALTLQSDLEELIRIFRKPGWTTPAEFRLVTGVVEGMSIQVQAIAGLKQLLLTSSREIAEAPEPVSSAR